MYEKAFVTKTKVTKVSKTRYATTVHWIGKMNKNDTWNPSNCGRSLYPDWNLSLCDNPPKSLSLEQWPTLQSIPSVDSLVMSTDHSLVPNPSKSFTQPQARIYVASIEGVATSMRWLLFGQTLGLAFPPINRSWTTWPERPVQRENTRTWVYSRSIDQHQPRQQDARASEAKVGFCASW